MFPISVTDNENTWKFCKFKYNVILPKVKKLNAMLSSTSYYQNWSYLPIIFVHQYHEKRPSFYLGHEHKFVHLATSSSSNKSNQETHLHLYARNILYASETLIIAQNSLLPVS